MFESEYGSASLMKCITRASVISLIIAFVAQVAWARGGAVHVHGYTRKDGTYVHAYDRAAPGTASSTAPISNSSITSIVPRGDTAARPAAPAVTQQQLDETYAQAQGFRSAEQYRKWKETGRLEASGEAAATGFGSAQSEESRMTISPSGVVGAQAKANPFRPQHFTLPSNPDP